ncbi:hypothetical protein [Altererythrobacter sp. TH136]|uniref:hypothetical protein n=1 Tax=Altererythrobacter sp. TH136 TaxID=2067415 RepID=UPI001161CC53|nr:hypothetical protein [Altererythrobacter sp. TH136]QDM39746.1 hypothetical protein C0V74_00785 [Altererythrobacter sp. TH136]
MSKRRALPVRLLLIGSAAVALAGCDAATQIAGDAVQGEARNMVAAQCEQVAGGAGIVAGRIAEVCQCAAETFVADGRLTPGEINRERIETIVNDCAARTRPQGDAALTEEASG